MINGGWRLRVCLKPHDVTSPGLGKRSHVLATGTAGSVPTPIPNPVLSFAEA